MRYANVMATVAVFIALGTGAWAAEKIGSKDIARDAVVSKHVKDGSLQQADFGANELPAGPRGAQGPQGPRGLQGPPGTNGTNGTDGSDATNLFAFVSDTGPDVPGTVGHGSGVTNFSDPAGNNGFLSPYLITFERDISNCVAHANLGATATSASFGFGQIYVITGSDQVAVFSHNTANNPQDTSFMLSVLC